MKRIALGLAIVATASTAHAYRPFDGTDASVATRGELELEVGPVGYLRANRKSYFAPAQVLNLGVIDRVEFVAQGREIVPGQLPLAPPPRLSLVDTGVFFKGVLREGVLQDKTGISIASEVGALLPTVNDEPGAGFSVAFIFSHQIDAGSLHLNLQGGRTRAGNPDLFVGSILEGPAPWTVRPALELYLDRAFDERLILSALGGFIGKVSDNFAIDGGGRVASVDGSAVFEARFGFTWATPMWR